MEYQKNISTNIYHGFGALINLIIVYVMSIQMKTGLIDSHIVYKILTLLLAFIFVYHLFSMKKPK